MANESKRELKITRVFDATRELVFKCWTDEKLLAQWWGPQGFTNPISELEPRPGGKINVVMEDSAGLIQEGSRYPMTGEFKEIVAPEKIVYTTAAIMNGKPVIENEAIVTFKDTGGKTEMTVHVVITHAAPEAEVMLQGMEMGWSQSLDKLAEFVKSL